MRAIAFRYITDALTPDEALAILRRHARRRRRRARSRAARAGYPAYTTSAAGSAIRTTRSAALPRGRREGWTHFKIKVGRDLADDVRRAAIIREEIGPDRILMMDANQVWDVDEAIDCDGALAPFRSVVDRGADEPRRHPRPRRDRARDRAGIGVATGEQCHNRVMFKQLLQADAIGFCQIDACRLGGVNEVLAVLLLAAKFGVPVCPHAGGVGLCEYVQHLAIFDYIAVSASLEDRVVEYVDHLHEHFVDPVVIRDGRYLVPDAAGLQHHDEARVARALRVPGRAGLGRAAWARRSTTAAARRGLAMTGRLAGKVALITGAGSGIGRAPRHPCSPPRAREVAVADVDLDAAESRPSPDRRRRPAKRRRPPYASTSRTRFVRGGRGRGGRGLRDDRRAVQQRGHRRGRDGRGDLARAVGAGHGGQRPRRVPRRQGGPAGLMVAARGSIINMSSTIAEIGLARRASYAASKGAVLALTRQMQADYARTGSGSTRSCRARSTRRSSTATWRRATTTRSPASSAPEGGSSPATSAGRRTSPPRRCSWPRTDRGSSSAQGLFVDGGVRGAK